MEPDEDNQPFLSESAQNEPKDTTDGAPSAAGDMLSDVPERQSRAADSSAPPSRRDTSLVATSPPAGLGSHRNTDLSSPGIGSNRHTDVSALDSGNDNLRGDRKPPADVMESGAVMEVPEWDPNAMRVVDNPIATPGLPSKKEPEHESSRKQVFRFLSISSDMGGHGNRVRPKAPLVEPGNRCAHGALRERVPSACARSAALSLRGCRSPS